MPHHHQTEANVHEVVEVGRVGEGWGSQQSVQMTRGDARRPEMAEERLCSGRVPELREHEGHGLRCGRHGVCV